MDISKKIRSLANKEIAQYSSRFFKTGKGEYGEGDQFLGVRVPELRKIAKEYQDISAKKLQQLLESRYHEERLTSVIIIANQFQKEKDEHERKRLFQLYIKNYKFINNWDIVDVSCPKVMGAYLINEDRKILYQWAKSKNLWKRRMSIMATFWFIRHNDLTDTFKIAHILVHDDHDLIHKAVGWMLREAAKKDMRKTEEFLKQNYKTMPRTMLRYAIEKYPEKKRLKYLKGTV